MSVEQREKWRLDPYGRGLWRVVAVLPGTPVVVNCGSDRTKAELIVAGHEAIALLREMNSLLPYAEVDAFYDRWNGVQANAGRLLSVVRALRREVRPYLEQAGETA